MSTPDDQVVDEAARIWQSALDGVNIEQYQSLLFAIGGSLSVWRAVMLNAGYSEYFIETCAWTVMSAIFGHHLPNQEVRFEPPTGTYPTRAITVPEGQQGDDQGGEGSVHGDA